MWPDSASRFANGLIACIVAGLATGGDAAASGMAEIRAVLAKPLAGDSRTREQVAAELAGLGQDAVEPLFDLYLGERWEELFEGTESIDVSQWWCPPDAIPELCLDALARMPARRVVERLDEVTGEGSEHDTRLAGLRVLAALGAPEGLPSVFRLGATFEDLALRYRSVQGPLEDAFARVLSGDPVRVARQLDAHAKDANPLLLSTLVTAIGRTGRPEYLSSLASFARGKGDLARAALEALPETVCIAPWRFDQEPCELLRPHLGNADWRMRRAAAFGLGKLRDAHSFRAIAKLLDDESQAVASAARWAVGQLARSEDSRSSSEWIDWYAAQEKWWTSRGTDLIERLRDGDPRGAADAVRELLEHPLYREETAAKLAALLQGAEAPLAASIVSGLRELGSKRVVPDLVWLLESQDPALRDAALRALGRLTGAELPPDPAPWRALVEG